MPALIAVSFRDTGLAEALQRSVDFCENVAYFNKGFGYSNTKAREEVWSNMTGIGVVCLQLSGRGATRQVKGGCQTIMGTRLPKYQWDNGSLNLYGWYYDTQAIFNKGGTDWE